MIQLAQGLAGILHWGNVSRMEAGCMNEDEQGYSGAEVIRQKVFFADGAQRTMIFKRADKKERCAMQRLTMQRQCAPACFSADVETDAPRWMAMEDLGQPHIRANCDEAWLQAVAEQLADIHAANMDRGAEMPWLPVADASYWQDVVTKLSVDHFARKVDQDTDFAREFGGYLPQLRAQGERFSREMTQLCGESGCMTLAHGDLQMRDGAHIYDCGGMPRIIDFGFCRYAPFYIDLAGWFGLAELKLYHRALRDKGVDIDYAGFEDRARAAYRYNGFIYMFPSMMDWANGPTRATGRRLLQALHIIINGDFPERRRQYSDALFARLLAGHKNSSV